VTVLARWRNPGSGFWVDANNWTTFPNYPFNGAPAGYEYDVQIAWTGYNPSTVTMRDDRYGAPVTINSLYFQCNSGTLWIERNRLQAINGINLSMGHIAFYDSGLYQTRITGSDGTVQTNGGTFDAVTIAGSVPITTGNFEQIFYVRNGLTLDNAQVSLKGMLSLVDGSQNVSGTGTITSDGAWIGNAGTGTVTTDAGITLEGSGSLSSGSGSFVHNGTLRGGFRINESNGPTGPFLNNGTLEALSGSTLSIYGSKFVNTGTIRGNGGNLFFSGVVTSQLGDFSTSSGGITRMMSVDNRNAPLAANDVTGPIELSGTLDGGTISGTATVPFRFGSATVSNVWLRGNFVVGSLLTLATPIQLDNASLSVGSNSGLGLSNPAIAGNGTIFFDLYNGKLGVDGGASLGTGVTVQTRSGDGIIGATDVGTVSNAGTIRSALATGSLQVRGAAVLNSGTLLATSGSLLAANVINSGTLLASGGTISLTGAWANNGTMVLDGGTIILGGSFTRSTLGTLVSNNGTLNISGTFLNSGELHLDPALGAWRLTGGKIQGGSITTATGSALRVATTGTLESTTLLGDVIVDSSANLWLKPDAILSNPQITLTGQSYGGLLTVENGQLTGNATISVVGHGGVGSGISTLDIGPDILIKAVSGSGSVYASGTFSNHGTIVADAATILFSGPTAINYAYLGAINGGRIQVPATIQNFGTIEVDHGTLALSGTFSPPNLGNVIGQQQTMAIAGTLNLSGQTLTLNASSPAWINQGTLIGGTISTSPGATFLNTGTLDGVTIEGHASTTAGTILNSATLLNGAEFQISGNFLLDRASTIRGNGEIILNNGWLATNYYVTTVIDPGITITNAGTWSSLTGTGTLLCNGTISAETPGNRLYLKGIKNRGIVQAINGGILTGQYGLWDFDSATLSGGTWRVGGGSTIDFSPLFITYNNATIEIAGPEAVFTCIRNLEKNLGTLRFSGGARYTQSYNLANSGFIDITQGSTLNLYSMPINTGTINIDGVMLIQSSSSSSLTNVRALLSSGAVQSEMANASISPKKTLAYFKPFSLGSTSFGGLPVSTYTVAIAPALLGDTNLDGRVNTMDFNSLSGGFGQTNKYWTNGDFSYDGTIDSLDFNLFLSNYGSSAEPSLGALIPEPTGLVTSVTVFLGLRRRGYGILTAC
jgi:hypothetical protein